MKPLIYFIVEINIIVMILLTLPPFNKAQISKTSVCNTTNCNLINTMTTRSIEKPCENFYNYICSKKLYSNRVNSATSINYLPARKTVLRDLYSNKEKKNITDANYFDKIQTFYKSCTNKDSLNVTENIQHLEFYEALADWPIFKSTDSIKKWIEVIYEFREIGFSTNFIFTNDVDFNFKNLNSRMIHIDQPSLGLNKVYLVEGLDNSIVQAYKKLMIDIVLELGRKQNDKDDSKEFKKKVQEDMEQVLQFELELAQITIPENEIKKDQNYFYNPRTVAELKSLFPSIDWQNYFNAIFSCIKIEDTEIINVKNINYFKGLSKLMEKYDDSQQVIINYAYWRVTLDHINELSVPFRKIYNEFNNALTGQNNTFKVSYKDCADDIDNNFKLALSAVYVQSTFNKNYLKPVEDLVNNVQKYLEVFLREAKWLSDDNKSKMLKKIRNIKKYVGHPEELMDNEKLEDYYKDLNFNDKNYFENSLILNRFNMDNECVELRKPYATSDWRSHFGKSINADVLSGYDDIFLVYAGIINNLYFSPEYPGYLNHGLLGSSIGKAMANALLTLLSLEVAEINSPFDSYELLKKNLSSISNCFINHYYQMEDGKLNKRITDEMTKDFYLPEIFGLKASYLAYKDWSSNHENEKGLEDMKNFTENQAFWISYASMFCEKPSVNSDVEDNSSNKMYFRFRYRVVEILRNIKEFADDFNCKPGDFMNPDDRCDIW